jgi:hypothetical protein
MRRVELTAVNRYVVTHALHLLVMAMLVSVSIAGTVRAAEALRVGVFDIDATPPVGSPLAYDIMERREASLRLKGIVLLGNERPIVLVAVDWIGISGSGHTRFRETIARAVGTSAERVAVHCLHQHDAPRFDPDAETLLADAGLSGKVHDVAWSRQILEKAAQAARAAAELAQPVTHVGLGQAKVEKVASNRRILGLDGKVQHVRWTATKDPVVRDFPEGVIDPWVKSISFFNGDKRLAVLTYYATHPQSYYRMRTAHPDFPGMARELRQHETGVVHIHFNGAGGNVGAGKYNDGSPENRPVLAERMAAGMADALAANQPPIPVTADDLGWSVVSVSLPPAEHLSDAALSETLQNKNATEAERTAAAADLAFLRRCNAGEKVDVACLSLGKLRVMHLPGELFVEYQLNAAQLRPDLFVSMAAYGDYAPGYIGTQIAYTQGGYETSPRASRVAPSVEKVLMNAVEKLLAD